MIRKFNVALIHTIDPRGGKVGGIETFVRDYVQYHPDDMDLLIIGIDEIGDLRIGEVHNIVVRGRQIRFFPVMRIDGADTNKYAASVAHALTVRFFLACLKHYGRLSRILRQAPYSFDIRRIELSPLALVFRVPSVQMLHDGMAKGFAMSSLLRKYWWVKDLTERFALARADRFYCVNDQLTERLKTSYPRQAHKLGTLPTWANPEIFVVQPIAEGETLRIAYTGRMDDFKRPDIMFQVVAAVRHLHRDTVFHYVGDGDVHAFPQFADIADMTVLHGRQTAEGLAAIIAGCHIGILTSDFEGMPRSVMEFLATGRPVVALHLPQLEAVIHPGVSGQLVPRGPDQIERMAKAIVAVAGEVRAGDIQPAHVAEAVANYTPQSLLGKLYSDHRRLHANG